MAEQTQLGAYGVKVADPYLMREINKFHVLETIRRAGRTSRVEISDLTQLSRTTVSAITTALIEEGLIRAVHVKANGEAQRGRPRVMLELIAEAAHVIGIRLSEHQVSIALTDFRGEQMGSVALPFRMARQADEVVADIIEDGVRQCVTAAGLALSDVCGIGIGVPGIVDVEGRRSLSSPLFGMSDIAIGPLLEQRLKIPVRLEKAAHLVALAESWFGHGRDADIFAVVSLDQTVGLGLHMNGDVYRGAAALGAAFGHVKVGLGEASSANGRPDSLNAYASHQAIIDGVQAAVSGAEAEKFATAQSMVNHAVELARAGDASLKTVFERYGQALGIGLSYLINLVNPGKIILAGESIGFADLFEPAMRRAAQAHSFPAHFEATEIIVHDLDDQLWARGAAALILRDLYQAPWTVVEK